MTAFARQCLLLALLGVFSGQVLASESRASLVPLPLLPAAGERIVTHRTAGIALDGFDPVAFFDRSRPVPGQPEHELQHAGATWRFATAANLGAFRAAPDIYMPQFGGYDPLAVANGRAVAGLPQHFVVRDGRLFIFASSDGKDRFLASPDLLAAAIDKWPDVERQLAR